MSGTGLFVGAFGDAVNALQGTLQQLGLTIPASETTRGFFGPATRQALLQFQRTRGLPATGMVDQKTAALLQSKASAPAPTIHSTSLGAKSATAADSVGLMEQPRQGALATTPISIGHDSTATVPTTLVPAVPGALRLHANGEAVASLQGALTSIGFPISTGERDAKRYGPSTVAAVRKLQALSGLAVTGALDGGSQTAIFAALGRLGVMPGASVAITPVVGEFAVDGRVSDQNGEPLGGAMVIALDLDLRTSKELGRTTTDATGYYRISYSGRTFESNRTAADLQIQVLGARGDVAFVSDITYNAPQFSTINLPLGGAQREHPSEFSWLHATMTPLLGKLAPTELYESGKYRDLTFLAGQTGVAKTRIALWAVAAHVALQTELPHALFYALFRCNVPPDALTLALSSSSQGVDLAANAQRFQDAILSTPPAVLQKAISGALAANLLPTSYADKAGDYLARLATLGANAALNSTNGMGNGSIAAVFDTLKVDTGVQQRFIQLYTNAAGSGRRTFWSNLYKNPAFTPAAVSTLRFGLTVGKLTRGHMPLVAELAAMRSAGKVRSARDLARLTSVDWLNLLTKSTPERPIGVPLKMVAVNPQQALEAYAALLEHNFTAAYPTPAFSARLAADAKSPFLATQAVATFLDENRRFDLLRTNIDAHAKTAALSVDVRSTLFVAQRLARLEPSYPAMKALMAEGIHSSQQVYAMGRDRFLAKYSSHSAIGATTAARMYGRAEQTYGVALATAMRVNLALGAGNPLAIGELDKKEVASKIKDFPNLQTLFGPDSFCACQDCQSVLGPAAYLVDLLEFLKHRTANANQSVRDVLLARRPDIAQIELICANTNTALPYIDLVNELLEDAVAPPADPIKADRARQTTLTTAELNANPQYVNQMAYAKLAGPVAVYPWTLPFDLPLAETRAYLRQLGLDRVQLLHTFQKPMGYPSGQARAIAVETLGFTAVEADIVTGGTLVASNHSWDYWGLAETGNTVVDPYDPTKTIVGAWTDVLEQARVLLSRAALSYVELIRLLNTRFINNDGTVTISADPSDSCSVATMTLVGLTQDVLDRLQRFVRLWRRLRWNVYDLDDAIAILQNAAPNGLSRLNDQLLRQLAVVVNVAERQQLPVRQAVAYFLTTSTFGTIPTRNIPTLPGEDVQNSLYHDLFENLTVLNPVDPIFALNVDGTEIAAIATNPKLADHGAALIAALETSSSDITLAIGTFTDASLTLANLSTIYRTVQLASALGITLQELITLLAITESSINAAPFYERIAPFDGARPEGMLAFFEAVTTLRGSGLSVAQLDYVLRHVYDDATGVAPNPVTVGTLLLTLRNGLIKIAAETTLNADPTGAATRKELARLLSAGDVDTTMALLAGTSSLTTAAANAFIATALGAYMEAAAAGAKLVSGGALAAGQPRYEYVLENILIFERRTRGAGLVVQSLAQALGIVTASAAVLVSTWFPSASSPGKFLIDDFLGLPGIALADIANPIPPNASGFASYFGAYAALAKTALLIVSQKLTTQDVEWWRDVGVAQGWIDPTALPEAATATAEGRFYRWTRLLTARSVRDRIPATDRSFASAFNIAGGGTSKAQYMIRLSAMTQWPRDALQTFCGDPNNNGDLGLLSLVYPDDFLAERALSRLMGCFQLLARTGIPADVSSWLGPTVSGMVADAIKQSVKANFGTTQWLALAKQLRDGLREQQRDALVSYLLANPPVGAQRWLDSEDVFARYLIDVEMCSCQSTSRIVQATAAVQLFIQRCLLNLETEVAIDSADGDWLQWQWMNQYRVWQANREVFLFPENWIDPTLRQNKSPFFSDLQQELKQTDFTNDVAEVALENYLEKLEVVARLDVCGTFHDLESGKDLLHVIARSQGSPPVYYSREWIDSSRWSAWQKVDLDIASDHVLPIVWNGKRYLFWALVAVKADQNNQPIGTAQDYQSHPPPPPHLHLEVQLAWSQFKQRKWQAKQTAPQTLVFPCPDNQPPFDSSSFRLLSSTHGQMLQIDIFLDDDAGGIFRSHCGCFLLGGAGSGVEAFVADIDTLANIGASAADIGPLNATLLKPQLVAPTFEWFDGDWIRPDPYWQTFYSNSRLRISPLYTVYDLYGAGVNELVLNRADNFRLILPHQLPRFDSSLPFFYRDSARQYFCVPSIYYKSGNYFTINAPSYVYHPFYRAEYRFLPFYHAFVPLFVSVLNAGGVGSFFARDLQVHPEKIAGIPAFDFYNYYAPSDCVLRNYPTEGVDFEPDAGYAIYNWELFFHTPFLIAESLSSNQRFAEAKKWYEYIFNPTSTGAESVPQRYWITKPFYNAVDYSSQQLAALMQAVNAHDPALEHQVAVWRNDPFDPDTIAQMRPVAYQRAIIMKYIDNLIKWGDQLFTQDTMESINQATELYVLALSLLGPRPQIVTPRVQPDVKTYADLMGNLDVFSNELVAAENAIPPVRVNVPGAGSAPKLPTLHTLYFRIPPNDSLLTYWDTVSDRLFKIRHCMNIHGVVQQLPLFAPSINPGLLVAAAAAGLDLGSILSDLNAALPPYRFATMIQQATSVCEVVRQHGEGLLSAMEKSDAEAVARLRSCSEKQLQGAIADVRNRQIDAAKQQIDVLDKSKQSFTDRANYYNNLDLMNEWEGAALVAQGLSLIPQAIATALEATAAAGHLVFKAQIGASGVGGSPHVSAQFGGENVGHGASAGATVARIAAAVLQTAAQLSTIMGQYHHRQDEWKLEGTLATDELARIDSERLAAQILQDVATKEQSAQDIAAKAASDVDAYLHSKFTNQELYDWMVGETSTAYFQTYQLAYSIAKQAEQCFRRELAISDSNYIQFGYWDSLRKGLTAGDKLHYDLQRLASAYLTQNVRELEITKHVSLLQLDPYALVQLRNNGTCVVDLPELLFDLDNPGHYLRRLKTVGLSVPCVVGPYTGVSLTLNLLNNQTRTSTDTGMGYPRLVSTTDIRFVDDPGGTSEIVTSSAESDAGLFELRFDDERYLPFEGAGAISTWRITLNSVFPQFDYSTIADLVLHVRFTARDGGGDFAAMVGSAVKGKLNSVMLAGNRKGLYRLFNLRYDYGTNWAKFLNPGTGNDQLLTIDMPPDRFPFFTYGMDLKVSGIDVIASTVTAEDFTLVITVPGGTPQTVTLVADPTLNGVHHWNKALSPKIDLGHAPLPAGTPPPTWSIKLKKASATDFQSLTASDLDAVLLVVGYQVS
jgi:peptidoglycan hydrolase-like protein with peptidoglycan-binding domain